jgi:hypothetical protein
MFVLPPYHLTPIKEILLYASQDAPGFVEDVKRHLKEVDRTRLYATIGWNTFRSAFTILWLNLWRV